MVPHSRRNVPRFVLHLFRAKLDICHTVFLLNARDATSLELKQLKARLTDWRTEIIQVHGNF